MKVRKEQFLLPKAKNMGSGTTKWIQANRKPCTFTQTLSCTSITSQPQESYVEGLPSALLTKIKSDVILPNGDIIVSSHKTGSLIWQQQDGILRQALLSTEKDVKSEEKISEPLIVESCQSQNETHVISGVAANSGLLTIATVTPQKLTTIATSQVIKMNDYQVILSNEALPVAWQDNGRKNNSVKVSSLPLIKPKTDPRYVISDQQMASFTSLGNINTVGQNHFPTIVLKDGKSVLAGNLHSSPVLNQTSTCKKLLSKAPKTRRTRRKPTQSKKIMLKPASSLLTQTALDYRNKDRVESQGNGIYESSEVPVSSMPLETTISRDINSGVEYAIKHSSAEPVALISRSAVSKPTSTIFIPHDSSFASNLGAKSTESNLSLSDFSETLNSVKSTELNTIVYDPSSVSIVEHQGTENSILITSSSLDNDVQTVTLNSSSVLDDGVLIDSDTRVVCSDDQVELLHPSVLSESTCNVQNSDHTSDYHRDHTETILLSDIEHHEEHHTQEYTDNLLSQLSNSGVLPNMSSSQVSSVLNALVRSEKTDENGLNAINNTKTMKESVKCEPTEFVKIENFQIPNNVRLKTKTAEPKYRICELNKHTCFRCVNCMFLSLKMESVEKHWAEEHQSLRSDMLDKQLTKRQIRCMGCTNIFYSKYALQIHLLCDHNVITTEVHDIIAATVLANRPQRELKKQTASRVSKTKAASLQIEPNKIVSVSVSSPLSTSSYQSNITSVITQSLASVSTPVSFMETTSAKVDEQKRVSDEPELPSTPSFCLFSEIQLQSDKEEIVLSEYNSGEDDTKKLVTGKKRSKSPRRCKSTRSKMKSDFNFEIKYKFRCMADRCGVRVTSLINLQYHQRCHRPDTELLFCPQCNFSVINWSSLTPHLWREHKIDMDLYSCKLCNYKSNSYSKLINNHVKIHGDERPFLCDICGKGFKTTKQLRNHKVVHRARRKMISSGVKPGESESIELDNCLSENICNVCSRSFADSRILKHHTENVHNKARPYLCTFCTHTASSKSSLRMHIRQHTGEKPFSCNECDYITADHNSLRRHKMRHSGKRPYQCPHCTYNCIQATTYKSHLKNKHPGLDEGLMFSCPMCPFRTVKRENYLAHKAEHDLGGDPRGRRKKPPPPSEIVQVTLDEDGECYFQIDRQCEEVSSEPGTNIIEEDQRSALLKTAANLPQHHDVVVLLNHSSSIPSVEDGTIELIVPETSSV